MSSRHVSARLGERKTEAWALAMGVRVPLPHPGERPSRAHRGLLADVAIQPPPPRRSRGGFFGLRALIARLFGQANPTPSQVSTVVAALPRGSVHPQPGATAAEKNEPGLAA